MSRQTGKDFSSESEAAEDCHARPRTEWMIAAPSERQALDSLEQGKTWAQGFDLKIADYQERREGSETLLKSAEIIFANGSRMRAVPGKPDTVRATNSRSPSGRCSSETAAAAPGRQRGTRNTPTRPCSLERVFPRAFRPVFTVSV